MLQAGKVSRSICPALVFESRPKSGSTHQSQAVESSKKLASQKNIEI